LHHHNTTVANHIFNKECCHIYFLLTLFRYKVRKCFKNSLGWWVGFGRLGSFGFLKRWFVCREKPNVPNALAKNFLSCALGIFYFFLCRTVVWSGVEVSVRVVVLSLPLTVRGFALLPLICNKPIKLATSQIYAGKL
jgi:fatty acid desaturase